MDGDVTGEEVQVFGVADDPTYRDHWPLIASQNEVWDKIAKGEGALINEQMWRRGVARMESS